MVFLTDLFVLEMRMMFGGFALKGSDVIVGSANW